LNSIIRGAVLLRNIHTSIVSTFAVPRGGPGGRAHELFSPNPVYLL
jgi:hypothetical protein